MFKKRIYLLRIGFLFLLTISSTSVVAMSACTSAARKDSLEDQIRLYTLCIEEGNLRRGNRAGAYNNRGTAYLNLGDYDRALSDFTNSIRYDDSWGAGYFNRSYIYIERGELELAIADLDIVVRSRPSRYRAEAFLLRGDLHSQLGNIEQALSDYDDAIDRDKKLTGAYLNKAWLLVTAEDEQYINAVEAIEAANKAIDLAEGDDVSGRVVLAGAYAQAGQFDDAVRVQTSVIESGVQTFLSTEVLAEYLELYRKGMTLLDSY